MFSFSGIKLWLISAVGVVGAVVLAALYLIGIGKKVERADSFEQSMEEQRDLQAKLNEAHRAGSAIDSPGGVPIGQDPNNRANSRKRPS